MFFFLVLLLFGREFMAGVWRREAKRGDKAGSYVVDLWMGIFDRGDLCRGWFFLLQLPLPFPDRGYEVALLILLFFFLFFTVLSLHPLSAGRPILILILIQRRRLSVCLSFLSFPLLLSAWRRDFDARGLYEVTILLVVA